MKHSHQMWYPPPSNVLEQRESDFLAEEVEDQEEDEHLALAAPEGEEREDEEEESEEDENVEPPLGMPGQLPTEKDQANIKDNFLVLLTNSMKFVKQK
jgi:hypothetical protein